MLKAWTETETRRLLILGLTFTGLKTRMIYSPIQNFITLRREVLGSPCDVALITADTRDKVATALQIDDRPPIVASHDVPIWYFVRMKNRNKVLHVCMTREESLTLRKYPFTSFYRLTGSSVDISFDTLLFAGKSEQDMADLLRRTALIDQQTRIELDTVQLKC